MEEQQLLEMPWLQWQLKIDIQFFPVGSLASFYLVVMFLCCRHFEKGKTKRNEKNKHMVTEEET